MKEVFNQQKAFYWTLLTSLLIIIVSVLTLYEKNIVGTGNLKVYGSVGTILAIGLLFKVTFIRKILAFISLIGLIGLIFISISSHNLSLSNIGLGITLLVISYLLLWSKHVYNYLNGWHFIL